MLVTHSKSLIWFRSIFSSDKAESGNKLDRGRKLGRWGREKMRGKKKPGVSGSPTRQELKEFVFQRLQLQLANQVRKDTHRQHTCIYNSWQALASTSTGCRSQGALVISIQYIRSFLCLRRVHTSPIQVHSNSVIIFQIIQYKDGGGRKDLKIRNVQKCTTSHSHTEEFIKSFTV